MLCMHATRSGAVSYLPVVLLARRNRFVCASASGRSHVMEERDNIVSHLQRLFSPQPESHVSDPQTTTEASRTATVGLLSEDVATDAQDKTDNFVPVAEERDGAFERVEATAPEAAAHAASDTPVVSADVSASGGANPRLATLGLHKTGVTKVVGIEAPLLSDQQSDVATNLDLSTLHDQLTGVKSILQSVSSGNDHSWEIEELMSTLDDREGGITALIREIYQFNSTLAGLTLQPSLEVVNELTRDYEYCKLARMHNDNAYQENFEKPDLTDETVTSTRLPSEAPPRSVTPPLATGQDSSTLATPFQLNADQLGAIIAAVSGGSRPSAVQPTPHAVSFVPMPGSGDSTGSAGHPHRISPEGALARRTQSVLRGPESFSPGRPETAALVAPETVGATPVPRRVGPPLACGAPTQQLARNGGGGGYPGQPLGGQPSPPASAFGAPTAPPGGSPPPPAMPVTTFFPTAPYQPKWYFSPGVGFTSNADITLAPWASCFRAATPHSAMQAKALRKNIFSRSQRLTAILSNVDSKPAMYSVERSTMMDLVCRVYVLSLYTQLQDGASLSSDCLAEANRETHEFVESSLSAAALQHSSLSRLLMPMSKSTVSPETRLYDFFFALDGACLQHRAAAQIHAQFYGGSPKSGDTPVSFFDRLCTDGVVRGFSALDIISFFTSQLGEYGEVYDGMSDILASDAVFDDVTKFREKLNSIRAAARPFPSLPSSSGRGRSRAAPVADAMLTDISVEREVVSKDGEGRKDVHWDSSRIETDAPASAQVLSVLAETAAALRTGFAQLPGQIAGQLKAAATAPVPAIDSFLANAQRLYLDLKAVYPKLFPGKPIPAATIVGPECVACQVDRPMVTEWLRWDEHPELHPDPATRKIKLAAHQGWYHNAKSCRCLVKRAQAHVATHPEDAYILKPAPLPPRA